MVMPRFRVWMLFIGLLFFSPEYANAQVDRAVLSGIVSDTSGDVVPGASVVVTNLSTDAESREVSSATGSYQIGNLIPGRYRVEVELTGFKKSSQVVTLEVGQRARL